MTLAAVLTALAAIAALGGCGSSSGSSSNTTSTVASALSQTPYGKQLSAVCTSAGKTLSALPGFPYPTFNPLHPEASKLPAIGRFFERTSAPAFQKILLSIDKVQPPPTEKGQFDAFRSQYASFVANLKRQIAAAKASDVSGFVVTVRRLSQSTSQLHRTEALLGVTACTKVG